MNQPVAALFDLFPEQLVWRGSPRNHNNSKEIILLSIVLSHAPRQS